MSEDADLEALRAEVVRLRAELASVAREISLASFRGWHLSTEDVKAAGQRAQAALDKVSW